MARQFDLPAAGRCARPHPAPSHPLGSLTQLLPRCCLPSSPASSFPYIPTRTAKTPPPLLSHDDDLGRQRRRPAVDRRQRGRGEEEASGEKAGGCG